MLRDLSESNTDKKHITMAIIVLTMICIIGCLVYISGGTADAFTHLMYIPIIITAYYFNIGSAIAASILSGLVLGPWMPANISSGTKQETYSWLFRLTMFTIIGIISGYLFRAIKLSRKREIKRSFRNEITGLQNEKKLKLDLEEMINENEEFSLIGFKILNVDRIGRFISYEVAIHSIKKAIQILSHYIGNNVYSIYTDEFIGVLHGDCKDTPYSIGSKYINQLRNPLSIDRFKVELLLKGSIVSSPINGTDPDKLLNKMEVALGQETDGTGLVIYDSRIEQYEREKYELTVDLLDAINNQEFYIVYQPKISLDDNYIAGVEALLRWNNRKKGQISPEIFIKIAEDIGLIDEITKWAIGNVIDQIKKWKSEGLLINVAINISSKNLKNYEVIDYLIRLIEQNSINPEMIELELTERCALGSLGQIEELVNYLKRHGIKMSLDDVGSGYNSLLNIIKIPVDYLKIDKTIIDNIIDDNNMVIIEAIIDFAHKTGKKVIAEGVETKAELEILTNMGCDYIQGYYFSKPLLPEKIKDYVDNCGSNLNNE